MVCACQRSGTARRPGRMPSGSSHAGSAISSGTRRGVLPLVLVLLHDRDEVVDGDGSRPGGTTSRRRRRRPRTRASRHRTDSRHSVCRISAGSSRDATWCDASLRRCSSRRCVVEVPRDEAGEQRHDEQQAHPVERRAGRHRDVVDADGDQQAAEVERDQRRPDRQRAAQARSAARLRAAAPRIIVHGAENWSKLNR